jgi:hypothetical protein
MRLRLPGMCQVLPNQESIFIFVHPGSAGTSTSIATYCSSLTSTITHSTTVLRCLLPGTVLVPVHDFLPDFFD